MFWMIDQAAFVLLREARRRGPAAPLARELPLLVSSMSESATRVLRVAGTSATITIEGILTKGPDLLAQILGYPNTSYQAVESALANIEADPTIRSVVFEVDSPGGAVDGLFSLVGSIEAVRRTKAVSVRASKALSAAYVLAAAAGPIEATSVGSMFGSVGVAASIFHDESIVDITNTESPTSARTSPRQKGRRRSGVSLTPCSSWSSPRSRAAGAS